MDLGLQQETNLKFITHGRLGFFIGLLCPALYAGEIDLKLTTSDGSTQVSVVNGGAANVAAIDSAGNITFNSTLKPNGQPGTAGQVLQSNGAGVSPTWVAPTPLPTTLLSSTNSWTAQQAFSRSVTISSNLVVDSGGVLSGNGSGLTNLLPGAMTAGVYGAITGVGTQGQDLNLNSHLINNLAAPAAGTDAATKAYVDTATGTVSATMRTYVDTATGTVSAAIKAYVDTATGTVSAAMGTYVDVATGAVKASVWSSTANWTAQQTYTKQVTVSTSMVLSGSLFAGASAGSSGQLLQSQGLGSAPAWISSTTLLGGTPLLKQGPASLSMATTSGDYVMSAADFGVLGSAAGGVITVTLPAASTAGMLAFILKTDASINNVNIAPKGGNTIQGGTTGLTVQNQKRLLIADGGTIWYVMSQ